MNIKQNKAGTKTILEVNVNEYYILLQALKEKENKMNHYKNGFAEDSINTVEDMVQKLIEYWEIN